MGVRRYSPQFSSSCAGIAGCQLALWKVSLTADLALAGVVLQHSLVQYYAETGTVCWSDGPAHSAGLVEPEGIGALLPPVGMGLGQVLARRRGNEVQSPYLAAPVWDDPDSAGLFGELQDSQPGRYPAAPGDVGLPDVQCPGPRDLREAVVGELVLPSCQQDGFDGGPQVRGLRRSSGVSTSSNQ